MPVDESRATHHGKYLHRGIIVAPIDRCLGLYFSIQLAVECSSASGGWRYNKVHCTDLSLGNAKGCLSHRHEADWRSHLAGLNLAPTPDPPFCSGDVFLRSNRQTSFVILRSIIFVCLCYLNTTTHSTRRVTSGHFSACLACTRIVLEYHRMLGLDSACLLQSHKASPPPSPTFLQKLYCNGHSSSPPAIRQGCLLPPSSFTIQYQAYTTQLLLANMCLPTQQ